jgi:hypothetical protein
MALADMRVRKFHTKDKVFDVLDPAALRRCDTTTGKTTSPTKC